MHAYPSSLFLGSAIILCHIYDWCTHKRTHKHSSIKAFMNEQLITHSPTLGELAADLAKVQAEMSFAEANATNPFFKSKYTNMSGYIKTSRAPLTKYGFAITQFIVPIFDSRGDTIQFAGNALQTMLIHRSGEFLMSKVILRPTKDDIQSLGSYLTYMKRYMYASIIGVVSGEEDDDGEAAMPRNQQRFAPRAISPQEVAIIEKALKPEMKQKLLSVFKIDSIDKIPAARVATVMEWINNL